MMNMAGKSDGILNDSLIWMGRPLTLPHLCLIGRGQDNDVVVDDKEVSRRHAMIVRQERDWWLSDLGSRNGVRVNGIRLSHARRLRGGDELNIGAQTLFFTSVESDAPRTAALIGDTTRISAEGGSAPLAAALLCELIVTAANGEILEGEKAARWFFGKSLNRPAEAVRPFLPSEVCTWLERQKTGPFTSGEAQLELLEVDRRVIVTLCRHNANRYFLLVREESSQASYERLKTLGLSPREAEVMHWVCEGKTNAEISAILSVTVHTINRHMEHILAKLGVENRQKAIVTVLEKLRL